MEVKKQLFYNTIFLFLNTFLILALSALIKIIVAKVLPPNQLGILTTSLSIIYFLASIALLGGGGAVTKLVSEKKPKKYKQAILSFALTLSVITSLIISLVLFLARDQITLFFKLNKEIIYLLVFSIPIFSLFNLFYAYVYGLQKMKKLFFANVSKYVFVLASLIASLFLTIYLNATLILLFYLLGQVIGIFLIFERFSFVKLKQKRRFFEFSITNFISLISVQLVGYYPFFILPYFTTQTITGIFSLALSLTNLVLIFPSVFSSASFPIFSSLFKNIQKARAVFYSTLKYILIFSLPALIFLFAFKEPIILIISSPKYLPASQIIEILSLGMFFSSLASFFLAILYAFGKIKAVLKIRAFSAILFVIVFTLLTYHYSFVGSAAAFFVTFLIVLTFALFKIKNIFEKIFEFGLLAKIIFASIVFLFLVYPIKLLTINFWFKVALTGLAFLCYLLLSYKLGVVSREEFWEILGYFRSFI